MDDAADLQSRCNDLTRKLQEAEETLEAIRRGEVDAVVVYGADTPQVYTLRSADHPYRVLVEAMHEGALTVSTDGMILYGNRRVAELLGTSDDALPGRHFAQMIAPESREGFETLLSYPPGRIETTLLGEEREVPVSIAVSTLTIDDVPGFAVVITDLTEQKAREEAIQKEKLARLASEAANQAKDEFLITVSHELRTPLTSILGWATMLKTIEPDPDTLRLGIDSIEQSTRIQAALIEDLLDVSRIATGQIRLTIEPVDSRELLQRTLTSLRATAEAKRIQFSLECDPALPLCRGDSTRLQQVFWNLLSNALKFTPEGGEILVSARATGGGKEITFTVQDTGCGISSDFAPRLFQRFAQAETSSSRKHSGLGLGLSVARDLVGLHGGTISATSDGPDRGSVFTVVLPADQSLASGDRQTAPEGYDALPLAGLRVLAIDDDAATRDWLSHTLRLFGAIVHSAAGAAEAMQRLDAFPIDIVISDLAMPAEDGIAFVSRLRLRDDGRTVPAIALTAYGRPDDRDRLLAAGFNEYLRKPIDAQVLVHSIRVATGRRAPVGR